MHVLASTREITEDGFGQKATIELSSDRRRMLGLAHIAVEYRDLRRLWADLANERLHEASIDQKLEPRSRAYLARLEAEHAAEHVPEAIASADDALSLVDTRRRGVERWNALRQERELAGISARTPARDLVRTLDNGLEL
jgi:hypothetical protein